MQSLTAKLIIAFVIVCFIQALLGVFLVRETTQSSFNRFLREEAIAVFEEDIRSYYEQTGTWVGVREGLKQNRSQQAELHRPPPPGDRFPGPRGGGVDRPNASPDDRGRTPLPPHSRNPQFGLADLQGIVFLSNGAYRPGDSVPSVVLEESVPFYVDGSLEGYMLLPDDPMALGKREQDYLKRLDGSLLGASLGVMVLALGLGIWLARSYTKPIKRLTMAAKNLADGALGMQVPVHSKDEVGELTKTFNRMSSQLEEISEQRRRMTSDIAHDLRTPLTVLSGYLEALRNQELAPTAERFEVMYQEALHLSRLIDDVRMLAMVEAGELTLKKKEMPLFTLLERVKTSFLHQAEKLGIDLDVRCEQDIPSLDIDPDRMVQVLSNLVANALRYTSAGGRITLEGVMENAGLKINVVDNGEGISQEALPHLFDRFYRADAARNRTKGGTGLGLAIVKSLVEAHGGTILVDSKMGLGSTFSIILPRP